MTYGKRAVSLALAAVLLAGSLAGTPAEAAGTNPVLWLDTYDEVWDFSCGYARVTKNEETYFIDPDGRRLDIQTEYVLLGDFHNGLAAFVEKYPGPNDPPEGVGWIGTHGEVVYPTEYDLPGSFSDCNFHRGILFTHTLSGDSVALGSDGEIIATAPDGIDLFEITETYNGLAPAWILGDDGAYRLGFVDRTFNIILPGTYRGALGGFLEGGALVELSPWEEYGIINVNGDMIWGPEKYQDSYWIPISYGFWNGLLAVPGENGKWGAIDTHGDLVIPHEYDTSFDFHSGYAFVIKDETLQVIDTNGTIVLPQVECNPFLQGYYEFSFSEGLAAVCPDSRWGYIDTSGKQVIPCRYLDARPFSEGLAWVQREDGVWGILKNPLAEKSVWAEDEIWDAYLHEIVTERTSSSFQDPLTRLQCAELMVNLTELVTGRPIFEVEADRFTDTIDWMPRKGAAAGLIEGMGDGTWFGPEEPITREQLATMLCRAVRYIEGETGQTVLPASAGLTGYADADQVSPWAADSMAALTAAGLLQGTSATTLSPKDTTTVEQGILLALRAWRTFAE